MPTSWEITVYTEMLQLLDRYGTGFIFTAIIIVFVASILWILVKSIQRYLDMKFNEAQKKTPQQLKKLIAHELNINAPVNELIDSIRQKFWASRVAIMQYHNGWYTNSGSHKSKVSMTHEVVWPWIGNIAKDMQDIPSAIFTHANSRLLMWENMTIIYDTDTGEWNSDEWVVATYKSIGYESVYAFAIRKHWCLVAKVVVWYLSKVVLSDEDLDEIMSITRQIETLITLNEYEK